MSSKRKFLKAAADPAERRGPRYLAIRDDLLSRIAAAEWGPGDAIPAESLLATQYDASTGTMRKALDLLVQQNILVRRQGSGTYVQSYSSHRSLRTFFHLVSLEGVRELPVSDRLLSLERAKPDAREQETLGLRGNARVLRLSRTRRFSDGALMAETITLPPKLFPGIDEKLGDALPTLLYEYYERRFGIVIVRVAESVGAVVAGGWQADAIGCPPGTALLEIERIAYGIDEQAVERRVSWCESRARRYSCARG